MMPQQRFFERIQKVDVIAFVLGTMLLLFYGSIVISTFVHGDFNITEGNLDHRLPDIGLILQTFVGLSLFLSFLHRKFFGVLSTTFAFTSIFLIVYLNTQNARPVGGLLFGVFIGTFFLLAPSLYILFASFRRRS